MLNSGKKSKYSCVVRKKNSERNIKPYPPPFKLNGRSLKNIRDTYTTGSSRLDPGFYGVRVVHICVFFEFLCVPANCLSVYDIVFPMFWTFLW